MCMKWSRLERRESREDKLRCVRCSDSETGGETPPEPAGEDARATAPGNEEIRHRMKVIRIVREGSRWLKAKVILCAATLVMAILQNPRISREELPPEWVLLVISGWGLLAAGISRASSRDRSWTEHELWSANPLSGLVRFEGRRPRVASPYYPAFWHLNAMGALAMGAGLLLQGLVNGHYLTGLYGVMFLSIGISLWTGFKIGDLIKGSGATRNER